jgi:hypothetical protein
MLPLQAGQPIPNVLFIQPVTIGYVPSDLTQTVPPAPTSRQQQHISVLLGAECVRLGSDDKHRAKECDERDPARYQNSATASATRTFTFNPPFVSYDISTGLFSIYKDINVDTRYSPSGRINLDIMFNARLYNILPFPAVKSSTGYTINIPRNLETNTLVTSTAGATKQISFGQHRILTITLDVPNKKYKLHHQHATDPSDTDATTEDLQQ